MRREFISDQLVVSIKIDLTNQSLISIFFDMKKAYDQCGATGYTLILIERMAAVYTRLYEFTGN